MRILYDFLKMSGLMNIVGKMDHATVFLRKKTDGLA